MFIQRSISDTVLDASENFSVVLLTGPRQVGKTTLLKKLAEDTPERKRTYITLDDPVVRGLAANDPALFMQRYDPPLFIDEIQYAPELLPYIKMAADNRKTNGDFWLTGSQIFQMMKGVSESLAGRAAVLRMAALSSSEVEGTRFGPFTTDKTRLLQRMKQARPLSVVDVFNRILRGGMPSLYENPKQDLERFFSSYVQTYIQRDIRDLTRVGDELVFFRFLQVIASHTATMLVYKNIAEETGISAPTAKQWISLLVSTGLVTLIPPFFNNSLKRIVKAPKLYFLDTGLCAHLLKWTSASTLEAGAASGAFYETWIVSEIYKSFLNAGREPPLYYYRDKDKREIDLLMFENNTLFPIEIKKTAGPNKSMIRHFSVLHSRADADLGTTPTVGPGVLVCQSSDMIPLDERHWCIPSFII